MSIDDLTESLGNLSLAQVQTENMDSQTVQSLITAAIREATERTRQEFQATVDDLTRRLTTLETPTVVEEHREIEIVAGVECNETLDLVKSVPEFKGDASTYISWRQAAKNAHKLYEGYVGSSKYYQAVAILRNKITGNADTVLSSYNTVLNFHAILARLDFAYADKRSVFTLEQELSTLTQGSKTIVDFYNEVEQKLNMMVNKTIMTYEGDVNLIESLNRKYRQDALRVFVSGLKKPLCDILFSCKPADMPTALALAQEMATNQSRYHFAKVFGDGLSRPNPTNYPRSSVNQNIFRYTSQNPPVPTNPSRFRFQPQQMPIMPNYQGIGTIRNSAPWQAASTFQQPPQNNFRPQQAFSSPQNFQPHQSQPIDSDVSMRTVGTNLYNPPGQRRPMGSAQVPNKFQRVNHLQDNLDENIAPTEELQGGMPEHFEEDQVNFLDIGPACPMWKGNFVEEN